MTSTDRARPIRVATAVIEIAFWIAAFAVILAWWNAITWRVGAIVAGVFLVVTIAAAVRKGLLLAIGNVESLHRSGPPEAATAPPAVFYRVNTLKIRLSEMRAVVRGRANLARAAALKLFRIRLPHQYMPDPAAIELLPAVPPGSRLQILLEESVRASRDAGLVEQFAYRVPQLLDIENLSVLFATPDRRMLTVVSASIGKVTGQTVARVGLLCWSRLDEKRRVTTTTIGGFAPAPPWDERELMRGCSVAEIVARHRERIAGRDVVPFAAERAGILNEFIRLSRQGTEYLLARGILEPMRAEEVAAVRQRLQMVQ